MGSFKKLDRRCVYTGIKKQGDQGNKVFLFNFPKELEKLEPEEQVLKQDNNVS